MLEQKTSATSSAPVHFHISQNGKVVVGDAGEKWDRIIFSSAPADSKDKEVFLQRFQLPVTQRYQGKGPRILRMILALYRACGCRQINVAFATTQGKSLYAKLDFKPLKNDDKSFFLLLQPEDNDQVQHIAEDKVQHIAEDTNGDSYTEFEEPIIEDIEDNGEAYEDVTINQSNEESDTSINGSDSADEVIDLRDRVSEDVRVHHQQDKENRPPRGTSQAGYLKKPSGTLRTKRALKAGSTIISELADTEWDTKKHGEGRDDTSPYITIKERQSGKTFDVIINRVPKAKQRLSYDSCTQPMQSKSCTCRSKCMRSILDPEVIREFRTPIFVRCESELEVRALLVDRLSVTEGKTILMLTSGSRKVCPTYYAAVHGISENRLKGCMRLARNKARINLRHAPEQCGRKRDAVKSTIAYSFWFMFFENNCQKPNDDLRLFPTDKTYKEIYSEYFEPWFGRQVQYGDATADQRPLFSCWKKARKHPDFADVKERAKHTHGRCNECATLSAMLLEAFKSGAAEREYRQRRRLHDEEVSQYRLYEKVLKARAVSTPGEVLVIMHDGTLALGTPRLTHRTIKNLDPARMEVVPWLGLDLSSNRKDYIYSRKSTTPKDANTLISQVHAMIRRAKSSYSHPSHKARELVLVADSASENKNNVLFAYCTDLVENGWFDSVELVFGPVGHTHNGVDSVHKIHNRDVGGYLSGDLGHFVYNYPKGFSGDISKMPSVSILERTIDWTSYYSPHLRPISGFTKTKRDKAMVRGFRIARSAHNVVDLRWKVDPASEQEWRGAGGYPNTAGFYLLKSTPSGLPPFVIPTEISTVQKETAKRLLSQGMRDALAPQGLEACLEWNYAAATETTIPIHAFLEESQPANEWGRLCEIGAVPGKRGKVRLLKDYWDASQGETREVLWSLPKGDNDEHISGRSNIHHFSRDQELLNSRALPYVRYNGEKRKSCEVGRHGNNVDGGWREEQVSSTSSSSGIPQIVSLDAQADEDIQEPPLQERRNWYFEVGFDKCKIDHFAVGLAETTEGPSPYIFVGKIISVDTQTRTFEMKPWRCRQNPWDAACVNAMWYKVRGKVAPQQNPHYAVLCYAAKWNGSGYMPKDVKNSIKERNIEWSSTE